MLQELPHRLPVRLVDELGHGKLACAVDANEQKQFALSSLHFGNIDMEEADEVAFELLPLRLAASHVRQSRDTVALKTPMQCRARQMWNRGLQGIKAVIQRQQCMPPESDDGRFLGLGQDRRARFLWSGLKILDRLSLAPLPYRFLVDAQLPAQRRERSLRSLYCSSDGVRGRGASIANLAHNASFHS